MMPEVEATEDTDGAPNPYVSRGAYRVHGWKEEEEKEERPSRLPARQTTKYVCISEAGASIVYQA